jgi:DNA-binding NtrC family response regulator
MLRLYKLNVVEMNTTGVIQHDAIVFDMSDYITIPLEPDNIKYNRKRAIRERKKNEQHSRSKVKEETRRMIEEYERGEEDGR